MKINLKSLLFELKYWFYRPKWWFIDFRGFIKGKWFQLFNGFDYHDCWGLDHSLAKWILPRLKYLRKNLHGHPTGITFKEWKNNLDKMIFSFEYVLNEDKYTDKCYPKNYDFGFTSDKDGHVIWNDKRKANYHKLIPYEKRYDEGMKLFALYFRSLWD
ncbi:MAG: hypothetical protein AABY22_29085 [Nanoarchaeota archaeon]